MAEYFTLLELLRSETADRLGIRNLPSDGDLERLEWLITHCLDPIRKLWGQIIRVNSGYRSPELNRAVGGSPTSQHMTGEAADITTGSIEGNRRLFDMIVQSDIDFDQLIDENGYHWLHVSCKIGGTGNRHRILHLGK